MVATSKDPKSQAVLNDLVKPIGTYITAVQEFRDKNRGKRAVADHLTALAEGIPALGWVLAAPKTAPYVQQFKEAAEFYTNRVLKEFKDKYAAATHRKRLALAANANQRLLNYAPGRCRTLGTRPRRTGPRPSQRC